VTQAKNIKQGKSLKYQGKKGVKADGADGI